MKLLTNFLIRVQKASKKLNIYCKLQWKYTHPNINETNEISYENVLKINFVS